jgi:hypothetical protein
METISNLAAGSFWSTSSGVSLITGLITACTALGAGVLGFFGNRRTAERQLEAAHAEWRRDHLLSQLTEYLATARGVADQAFLVGATQVQDLRRAGRPEDPSALSNQDRQNLLKILERDGDLTNAISELSRRQHRFSELVHGAKLMLAPNDQVAERLRKETDQFFGYVTERNPEILDAEIHDRSDACGRLRNELERQVSAMLRV